MRTTYLICGLGNPGEQYKNTRHNVGFMILDEAAKKFNERFKDNKRLFSSVFTLTNSNGRFVFIKPNTFMNMSGVAIKAAMSYFDIDVENVIVFVDDVNLPFGCIRLRPIGGDGGHNGLKNIISCIGENGENFKRIRIGLGANDREKLSDYVLSELSKNDVKLLQDAVIPLCIGIIENVMERVSFSDIMTKYNSKQNE